MSKLIKARDYKFWLPSRSVSTMTNETDRLLGNAESPRPLTVPSHHGFSESARRSSFVSGSVGRPGLSPGFFRHDSDEGGLESDDESENRSRGGLEFTLNSEEAIRLAREEEELLEDNHLLPKTLPRRQLACEVEETARAWDEAVENGAIHTTPRRELITLARNSAPLVVTFILQYSLTVASIFSVGHLGKTELGAVSLGSMTVSITGHAMIQGLATCLDTFCAQAYGAGNYKLVGMYFQKCAAMIFACFIPVAILWWNAEPLLSMIVPEKELAVLAEQYLRIVGLGVPGYILFECGKRFVQAQGLYSAGTYVLVITAPINVVLNYVLVWNKTIGMGFAGAPTAVAISEWTMAILLFLYVVFFDGKKCWNGWSLDCFRDWRPLLTLAIPGVIMVEAEFLAFEALTLGSSHFGTTALAAQSILSTVCSLSYQVPFAVSIAASTRIANFVGATLADSAKIATRVSIYVSYLVALANGVLFFIFRYQISSLFSNDKDVIELVASVAPMIAFMQLFDGSQAAVAGVLRGQGRQDIGGYVNLAVYYIVGLPLAFGLAFGLNWGLLGFWTGITVGLALILVVETWFVRRADWDAIVLAAKTRTSERVI